LIRQEETYVGWKFIRLEDKGRKLSRQEFEQAGRYVGKKLSRQEDM